MRNLLTLLLLCSSLPSLGAQYARDLRVETPLMLRELGASPAGLTGYGQLYTKTLDNDLYFMDSLGNQFNVLLGGAAGAQLNDLSDVDTFTASPTAGQFLKFNGSLWVPGDIPIINALDDIGDVNVASATEGQVLTRVGTEWQAKDASGGVTDHNSLNGLQGGTTGEYYHLTAAEDIAVASLSGTTTNYVLKRSATGFANSAIYDDGGNIGIGTTSATGKLDVVGTMVTRGAIKLQSGSASGSFLFGADVNATTITTNTRKLARASMPSYDTSIANITLFAGDSTAIDNIVSMGGVAGSTAVVGATQLSFFTATTTVTTGVVERIRVDKVGNVGIGTISPGARLQIEKNDEPFTSGEHILSLIRRDSNGGGMIIGYQSDGTIINANTIRGSGSFDVWFGTASNRSAIVVSNTTGNVGMGNTAPAVKLDVTGDVAVSGYQYFGSPTVNGSFRMYVSGGALKVEKRISGTWTSVGQFDEL